MSRDLDIVRVRVHAVAPAGNGAVPVVDNILRLTAANGLEGWASSASDPSALGGGPDRSLADRLRAIAPQVLGASALEREAVSERLLRACGDPRKRAESAIDIALWDLAARAAGEPLWRLLGGARDRIAACALAPAFDDIDACVAFVGDLAARGYRAVKLRAERDPGRDLAMAGAVHAAHGARMAFMLAAGRRYDLGTAVRIGRRLAELGFVWFEAPFPDEDVAAYAELRRAAGVPVVPAGDTLTDLGTPRDGIAAGAWSRLRTGPAHNGGVSATARAMGLAAAHGTTVELRSHGSGAPRLAALHLALGLGNCGWFERPAPGADGRRETVPLPEIDGEGCMSAPAGPGLGAIPEWDRIEADAFLTFDLED